VDDWRTVEATRQADRRDINEVGGTKAGMTAFLCECGDMSCTHTVSLSLSEYEVVRAHPTHFVIATNHENPEVEWVVSETERFSIVETFAGSASRIALRTDPRVPKI